MRRRATTILAAMVALGLACEARAQPLEDRIPGLFGGALITSISPTDRADAQRPQVADRFRGLSGALAAARSQAPVPSASGAFRFAWDAQMDTFVRVQQSLGSLLAERAQTLGRHTVSFNVAYSHLDFDTFEGEPLSHIRTTQATLSPALLDRLPASDRQRAMDNVTQTDLSLRFGFDLVYLTAAYGLTDTVDVSLALSLVNAHMEAHATASIQDPNGDQGAYFTVQQRGVQTAGAGPVCSQAYRCAVDGFDDSAFGTGDLFLRGKWNFYGSSLADLAVVAILTLPTGNADEYLGFHDPTFTPWFVASSTWGPISPHLNLGYAFRSGADVSQALWVAGADLRTTSWLTLSADFLGYHDDNRDGINDDVFQAAPGFKLNPLDGLVLGAAFQLPLNSDGLRADVIYTTQIEYAF
jgi:hypothetical protein